jgi:hypothetical protein
MDRYSNIFFKVTPENEDTTSEILCNIFRSKYIRDISLEFLGISSEVCKTIILGNISTRSNIDGVGIPDIKIENNFSLYFIENKIHIDTDLQESQITTYPEYINKKNKASKGYIFLIPRNYKHEIEIDKIKTSYPFVSKKYWEDFLDYLYEKEIHNESPVINEVLDYLKNLVSNNSVDTTELNINEVVVMYNPKDIYNVLSFTAKINKLIDNVSEEIVKTLGQDFSVFKDQKDQNGVGKYLKHRKGNIFIGLNPGLCEEQNGEFVFSVALEKKALDYNKINKEKYPYFIDDEWIYIKIDRKTLVDVDQKNVLINTVVDIIKNVFLENI